MICDYCGFNNQAGEGLEPKPRGDGWRCEDRAACDQREETNHVAHLKELQARRRAGDELTDAEKADLAEG